MSEELVVRVKQGLLRGTILESVDADSYISFKGIPFAAPPLGELRFKDPQPPASWSGVRDASKHAGDICLQFIEIPNRQLRGSEDCLYLNIYSTSISECRPVMVWIHGGGFVTGSGNDSFYGPDYLIKKDIVYVFINYRLGVLGFLNLEHESAPGNQGLKDQVAALRWVKENISAFGGDPNNVTIFGNSCGSASVHYLSLSPLAKGLFHKAICQSGTAINSPSSMQSFPRRVYHLAEFLGMKSSDPTEVVEFLRSVPAHDLLVAQERIMLHENLLGIAFPFGPNVDVKSPQPFLPRSLCELIEEGIDVPLILGYCCREATLFISDVSEETLTIYDKLLPDLLKRNIPIKDPNKLLKLEREIRQFYFNDKPITPELSTSLVDFLSHLYFLCGIHKTVDVQKSKSTPTYYYRFSFEGEEPTILKTMMKHVHTKGASHGDELTYLFQMPQCKSKEKGSIPPGTKERIVLERFLNLWTNFATTGNPTPRIDEIIPTIWKPITKSKLNYLVIGDNLSNGINPDAEIRAKYKKLHYLLR